MKRLAATLAASLLTFAASAGDASHASYTTADEYATRVLSAVNRYRESAGLPSLQTQPALRRLAAEHSSGMAQVRRPSHDGFARRFARAGGYVCVENVAQGFRVPEQVILGWRASPDHHRNLLEPRVRFVGVASEGSFVTFFACDETA